MGDATPAYIWNASNSVPIGLYRLQPVDSLAVTELVAVRPPEPLATFLDLNGYLPIGVLMLKRVLAGNGKVLLCGTCMDARGLDDAALSAGARRSTMDELATVTADADKVLVF